MRTSAGKIQEAWRRSKKEITVDVAKEEVKSLGLCERQKDATPEGK